MSIARSIAKYLISLQTAGIQIFKDKSYMGNRSTYPNSKSFLLRCRINIIEVFVYEILEIRFKRYASSCLLFDISWLKAKQKWNTQEHRIHSTRLDIPCRVVESARIPVKEQQLSGFAYTDTILKYPIKSKWNRRLQILSHILQVHVGLLLRTTRTSSAIRTCTWSSPFCEDRQTHSYQTQRYQKWTSLIEF